MPAVLSRAFWFALAILFLIEAWLWRRLELVVERLVAALPFAAFKRWLTGMLEKLPPYGALFLFVIPGILLMPFKFAALWLLARGQIVLGGLVFIAAKLVGTGVVAFLFHVCHDKLMSIGWFATLYETVMRVKRWAEALVAPYKRKLRAYARLIRRRNPTLFARRVAYLRRRAATRAA